MILSCIAFLSIAAPTMRTPTIPDWARQALSCQAALASAKTAHRAKPPSVSSPSVPNPSGARGMVNADPLIDPEHDRWLADINRTRKLAGYFERMGNLKEARRLIDDLAIRDPRARPLIVDHIVALEYLLGDKARAYGDLVEDFRHPLPGSDRPWLLLAAVAAANGQVFPGQAEYCREALRNRTEHEPPCPTRLLPEGRTPSPAAVEAAALVALVRESKFCSSLDIPFLERAWRYSPSDFDVARVLTHAYVFGGYYSKACRFATDMQSWCASEEERQWFKEMIRCYSDRPDRLPLRPGEAKNVP